MKISRWISDRCVRRRHDLKAYFLIYQLPMKSLIKLFQFVSPLLWFPCYETKLTISYTLFQSTTWNGVILRSGNRRVSIYLIWMSKVVFGEYNKKQWQPQEFLIMFKLSRLSNINVQPPSGITRGAILGSGLLQIKPFMFMKSFPTEWHCHLHVWLIRNVMHYKIFMLAESVNEEVKSVEKYLRI